MKTVSTKGTIFGSLSSYDDRQKFKIIEDRIIVGGDEIVDENWQTDYIARILYGKPMFPIIFTYIQTKENEYKARVIVFNYHYHRNMWVALNNKKSAGALNVYASALLN